MAIAIHHIKERTMNRFRNVLLGTAAVMLIVQALLFTGPGQALAQTITSVLVTNTASNPILVRDVDNGQQPMKANQAFRFNVGSGGSDNVLLTVPAGKRLFIETISEVIYGPSTQIPLYMSITSGDRPTVFLVLTPTATVGGVAYFVGTFAGRVYANPGDIVMSSITWNTYPVSSEFGKVSISGYYIDVPYP
jgi:hypothetical protein